MEGFGRQLAAESASLRARLGMGGGRWMRTALLYIGVVGIFGILVPWQKGRDFLDPVILGAYACLGVVFAAPVAAQEFEETPPDQAKASARILVSVAYGEIMALTMLGAGMATVYGTHLNRPIYVGPDLRSLADCAALGLAISLAITTAAVWLSVQFSARLARSLVRLAFLILLAGFVLRSGWLPVVALRGAAAALTAAILFFWRLHLALAHPTRSAGIP